MLNLSVPQMHHPQTEKNNNAFLLIWLWGWLEITSVNESWYLQGEHTLTALVPIRRHTAEPALNPQLSGLPVQWTFICTHSSLPVPREDVPPPDNESMPSHGWFFACCMRQHHKPLPDSLQLEQTLSDSLSLSFQGLFPPPTLPSIPASQPQPHSSSP